MDAARLISRGNASHELAQGIMLPAETSDEKIRIRREKLKFLITAGFLKKKNFSHIYILNYNFPKAFPIIIPTLFIRLKKG